MDVAVDGADFGAQHALFAPARLAPTMMWVWSLVMGCPRG
jgi:hypothetical protein